MQGIAILALVPVIAQAGPYPPAFIVDDATHEVISVPAPFEDSNPSVVAQGELYQSDILLTEEQWAAKRERKAIDASYARWTEKDGFPYVPYVFVDSVNKDDVRAGLDHWMEHTCIKFEKTSNKDQPHLKFHIGSGCWSYIGMIAAWKGQDISIGSGCNNLGTVVHEVGHAMGMYHEQSRSDRDDHVIILFDNIRDGKEGNFDKEADDNHNVMYDYTSNMHYGMDYFTKNGNPTIVTKNPMAQELIGSRAGLTHRDKLLANRMYKCLDKWLASCGVSDNCKNDGYIGANCKCVCPPGTEGDKCQTVVADYYDDKISAWSEKITSEKTIEIKTPMEAGKNFVKWIMPPECKKAKLTFTEENMYTGDCYFQSINIKTVEGDYAGTKLCRSDISPSPSFTSETGIILTMTNRVSYSFAKTLWKADVTFEDKSGCTPSGTTPKPEASTTAKPEPEYPELPCEKKAKTFKMPKGESRIITSPDYPEKYPKKSKCGWKIKAAKKQKLSITCDPFSLGKGDKLKIGKSTFAKDDKVEVDPATSLKIQFKSKKTGPGFKCIISSLK